MISTPEGLHTPEGLPVPERRIAARGVLVGLAAAGLIAVPVAALAVLVRGESHALTTLDQDVASAFHRALVGHGTLVDLLIAIEAISTPWVLRAIAAVVAVVLWLRRDRLAAIWLVTTMAVGGVIAWGLKLIVGRARPAFDEPITVALGYSFPSGHALNSMLFAASMMVLIHPVTQGARRVVAWVAAVGFVLLVSLDRVALGVHYLSDVLAGWLVALAVVAATTLAFGVTNRVPHLDPPAQHPGPDPDHPEPTA